MVFYFWYRLIQGIIVIIIMVMMMMEVAIILSTESSYSNEYLFGYLLGQQITVMLAEQKQKQDIA